MHLSEGVLSPSTLVIGYAVAIMGITVGLRKMDNAKLPFVALFSASFFVASTIHIPVGISSVHLILNGIAGLFLGWSVFPAFLIALILQLLLFAFGGFSVLGVNLCIMALPAIVVHILLTPYIQRQQTRYSLIIIGTLAGIIGVAGSALIAAIFLSMDGGKTYLDLIWLLLISHIPVFIIDPLISIGILLALAKMRPQIFHEVK